ncbi:TonB-dependent receptor [Stenotrophomonas sp. LGBM10]|uniref:TonB-dependent receptor n=1 Tax=Stenotrophomonas sp. LGBM10 TaxID=3390038 RepID=UPI00398B44BF
MRSSYLAVAILPLLAPAAWGQRAAAPPLAGGTTAPPTVTALDAITVTAQHREENAQKIALAVSVVDAQVLERQHITDLSALPTRVPSVTFAAGNELRNNAIRIRGVGTDVFSTGVEPSVSTVVDGVVLQRPGAAFGELVDVDRVEVLRGPQGTLFGKNASAGVISVITRAPDFERRSGTLGAMLAQGDEQRLDGALSGPLGDGLAYRVAGVLHHQGGDVRNLRDGRWLNGQTHSSVRGKLGWRTPDARSDATLSVDYSDLDARCCALPLRVASSDPRALPSAAEVGNGNTAVNNDVTPFVRQTSYGIALTANLAWRDHTLTSISAWRRFDNRSNVDLDDTQARLITANVNIESSRTVSQELRLASPIGAAIDYVVGAFYYDGAVYNRLDRRGLNITAVTALQPNGEVLPRVADDVAVLAGHSRVDSRNVSLFGQGNWHMHDRVTLTAGVRVIDDVQRLRFVRPVAGYFNGTDQPATNPAFGPVSGRYRDRATIGKASVAYAPSADITTYLAWSSGYKSQGLAATLGLTAAQFAQLPAPAETTDLFEAGVKSTVFDNALMLNLTAFHTRIADYQAQTYNAASGLFLLTSAGGVSIDGVELEFTARPHAYISVTGGATWLDARFDGVRAGPCYTGQSVAQGCLPAAPGAAAVQDLDGKPFMNAPRWRYVLGARYDAPLTSQVDLFVQADYRWQDAVVLDISQNPQMVQAAYGIVDLSMGLIFAAGRYELGLFVKNLADQAYVANIMAVSTAGGANAYAQQLARDARRYAGLGFRMHF